MLFTGSYDHAIDQKNRLAIPSRFRNMLNPERDGAGFFVVPGRPANTLWLYTERHFEALAQRGDSDLIPDRSHLEFDQRFFRWVQFAELDSQGRVVLPERLLKRAGLGKEVVICGVRDHLEIWPRGLFEEQAETDWERFPELDLQARGAYAGKRRQAGLDDGAGA